jgi:hypothetical protein
VPRGVLARVDIEMVDERRTLDPVHIGKRIDERVMSVVDALDEEGVELDSVAGREHGVLYDLRATLGAEAQRAEPLP